MFFKVVGNPKQVLEMDRGWMNQARRSTAEYVDGVTGFVKFVVHNAADRTKIRCPCVKCSNIFYVDEYDLELHLLKNGICKSYVNWTHHGEDILGEASGSNIRTSLDNDEEMHEVLEEDLLGRPELLEKLVKDSEQPLFEGSSFSRLDAVISLYNLKAKHGWTDASFTDLLSKVHELLPAGNVLPSRTYDAKQLLNSIGLKFEKIHACGNDCVLFRNEYASLEECPSCNGPRYKQNGSTPVKVMYYFPLLPRVRRMYRSADYASLLTWHSEKRKTDGKLRHPADARQWKEFDEEYPVFAAEPRNLRFVLSSDGMNPHGVQSNSWSTWPVVMAIYNLPPWLCMKRKYLMLCAIISGPKQPGNDIDVYLRPLVDELKVLWNEGIDVFDGSRRNRFQLRGMLFGTVNDFPAYGNLSGYSVKGRNACPKCEEDTSFVRLNASKKEVFMGHRRFLPKDHEYRKAASCFDGTVERRGPPHMCSGEEVYDKVKGIRIPSGKKFSKSIPSTGWKKCSIFWELPYWKNLPVRHFIDVMHQEKNVAEALVATLLGTDKTKDTENSRKDLVQLEIREELHPVSEGSKVYCAPCAHTLSRQEKRTFCDTLRGVKVPEGYSSSISSLVSPSDSKMTNLKSHDCHILMENFIPVAIRSILPDEVRDTITKLCFFFKAICCKVIDPTKLPGLQAQIVEVLCELEMYFPPSFFDIMMHLTVHLVEEIVYCGPPTLRWMYPFERYMKVLKGYVKNRSRPEGCMAERYLMEEAVEFCTDYMTNLDHIGLPILKRSRDAEGVGISGKKIIITDSAKLGLAHLYILHNSDEVETDVQFHKELIAELHQDKSLDWIAKEHNRTFSGWFTKHVAEELKISADRVSDTRKWLSRGPRSHVFSYSAYTINGYTFYTRAHDAKMSRQNSGVTIEADQEQHVPGENDDPICIRDAFYGVIDEIWELDYVDFQVPVFACTWVDNKHGKMVEESGFIRVDLSRCGPKSDVFMLATQASQVFYVSDPSHKKWSIVLRNDKLLDHGNVHEEEEYTDVDYVFSGLGLSKKHYRAKCFYLRDDHLEGIRTKTGGHGKGPTQLGKRKKTK